QCLGSEGEDVGEHFHVRPERRDDGPPQRQHEDEGHGNVAKVAEAEAEAVANGTGHQRAPCLPLSRRNCRPTMTRRISTTTTMMAMARPISPKMKPDLYASYISTLVESAGPP